MIEIKKDKIKAIGEKDCNVKEINNYSIDEHTKDRILASVELYAIYLKLKKENKRLKEKLNEIKNCLKEN